MEGQRPLERRGAAGASRGCLRGASRGCLREGFKGVLQWGLKVGLKEVPKGG